MQRAMRIVAVGAAVAGVGLVGLVGWTTRTAFRGVPRCDRAG